MQTKATIVGHPIHPMLVVFPIGLWTFSFICDLIFLYTGYLGFEVVAFVCIGGGILGALAATIPGIVDFSYISRRDDVESSKISQIAFQHGMFNVLALITFSINFCIRFQGSPLRVPFILSLGGLIFLAISGWLGAELVYYHRVGVRKNDE